MKNKEKLVLRKDDYIIKDRLHLDTIYSLSNGYIGSKGSLEEDYEHSGTFLNGFYETEDIIYGEIAYGYAKKSQQILKLSGATDNKVKITENGNNLVEIKDEQYLNMETGTLFRQRIFEDSKRQRVSLKSNKIVPIESRNFIIYECEIENLGEEKEVEIEFFFGQYSLNKCLMDDNDPRVIKDNEELVSYNIERIEDGLIEFKASTQESNLSVRGVQRRIFDQNNLKKISEEKTERYEKEIYTTKISENDSLRFKIVTQFSDICQDLKSFHDGTEDIDKIKKEHLNYYQKFWESSFIELPKNSKLEKGLNFNTFHLNQSAGRDGLTNIPAKGLTGLGYEGHYFWDTEMYLLPFFIYNDPQTARKLLEYRYSILDKARERARELAIEKGVLFPWRTINGDECSAYYLAGTAQLHINGDIAYGVSLYYEATRDVDFMLFYGIEILVETARFWMEYGYFSPTKNGMFVINEVTGPDEYTTLVDNNYYTNRIAQENLVQALDWIEKLETLNNNQAILLSGKLDVKPYERNLWKKAIDLMYFPIDETRQLTEQSDNFFEKKKWDIENTPQENFPLLLNYHPMIIYKHQVCKQADTILSHVLFGENENIKRIKNDFYYYDKITTHDSSLSKSAFSIIASKINDKEKAYEYFTDTVLMDLEDAQGNVKDGVHIANMGGSLLTVLYGFAGISSKDGVLRISPAIPNEIGEIRFNFKYQGRKLRLELTQEINKVIILSGNSMKININGSDVLIEGTE